MPRWRAIADTVHPCPAKGRPENPSPGPGVPARPRLTASGRCRTEDAVTRPDGPAMTAPPWPWSAPQPGWRRTSRPRPGSRSVGAQADLIAEMSNSSLILSLTSMPPVSSAALKVMPQSERLIVVLPSKPTRMLP